MSIIGIIGGTGDLGKGLSLRWAKNYTIFIGSRRKKKAEKAAKEYLQIAKSFYKRDIEIKGLENSKVAEKSDIVVLTIPFDAVYDTINNIAIYLHNKIVISPIVPMKKIKDNFVYSPPKEGSVALLLRNLLPSSVKLVAGLHNLSAKKLMKLDMTLEYDVLICGDQKAKDVLFKLVREIKNLRPLDVGPLENSYLIESLTPLLLNIALRNKIKSPSFRIIS